MNETDTDISFDEKGICNHCNQYIDYNKKRKLEKQNLQWLYHNIRKSGRGKKYDCLLGVSGGVDSSLCLHYLVENGIRPFCFSVDNGWNTPESDENIMRLVEGMKVPFYRYVLDLKEFKELQEAFIESGTANIEIPTDHILTAASYEMARKYGIKYIISGGNWATESIMPKAWGYQPKDLTFIKNVYKEFKGKKIKNLYTLSLLKYIMYRFIKGVKIINLLDYYEYNREGAKKLLNEKYGYKDYGDKHCENVFTKWFQNYWLPYLHGIDKRYAHYSSLINSEQMTRDQALKRIEEPLEYPKIDIGRIVDGIYNGFFIRRSYREFKNSEYWWELLSKVYAFIPRRK